MTPTPIMKVYSRDAPRARRFSASFSPHTGGSPSSKVVPRISQIRQEECPDLANAREANHEREVLSDMQMSQSCEDLTLITESWSFKAGLESDAIVTNPLHLNLTSKHSNSPSPTRHGLRLPYHGLSPSPTRQKTFATRRSMSPIAMRPSQLAGSVKRKFELDDGSNTCSPPPIKKIFIDRNPSPSFIRQTPSPLCLSPDSSFDGRITPKHFISKLTTNPPPSSVTSSPATEVSDTPSEMEIESNSTQPEEKPPSTDDSNKNTEENDPKAMRVDEELVTTTTTNL